MVFFSRPLSLTAFAALLSLVTSDPESICYSYGVDFVDEGSYFINEASTEAFTAVSTFKGCQADLSDILFVDPNDTEYLCSKVETTPDDDPKLSTCPIQKSQMSSGHWILLILGNNGKEGQPFAWQRDLYITVGAQATMTYTPTVTFSITEVPVTTMTATATFTDVSTIGPLSTVTIPSGTAKKIKTVTPKAVTATSTKLMTRTSITSTRKAVTTTKTVTATCTTPGRPTRPDKPCTYSPTLLHPAALVTPTSLPKLHRFVRKSDRAVDYEWARARVEAAKQKRARIVGPALERRAPDAPTSTITGTVPVSTTTTIIQPTLTTTESVLQTVSTTTTLPAATVLSGLLTLTTTLPTPTKTKVSHQYITITSTKNFGVTYTRVTTVTPTSAVSACKKKGGHFW
ncbi:hypothetical protein P153DRAFT_365098 [Dothidotthia symphoricarpi CBS 119687]|uniref:Lytic polysaccharide monooxygenase n=1 Tax=Dothidotthia symphoricarpi CBS 119687 TaxID=1392245 RepID=A0A6A6AHU5_9PLEO|nr:uncharacterized protein P153DRAFT_365098 [Dothidotthia symphoricarpi CBS 119687]KAF2131519.1 hypothetical protein P153DRAFT_365098 [Dothidotthia symphoricarpi CBS 119687]